MTSFLTRIFLDTIRNNLSFKPVICHPFRVLMIFVYFTTPLGILRTQEDTRHRLNGKWGLRTKESEKYTDRGTEDPFFLRRWKGPNLRREEQGRRLVLLVDRWTWTVPDTGARHGSGRDCRRGPTTTYTARARLARKIRKQRIVY